VNDYDDGLIACTDAELVIRRYDAFQRPKRIPYAQIRSARQVELSPARRWRIWGSGDLRHWWNYDSARPKKQVAFVLDLGKHWQPVITPDDPERVAEALRSHGVTVESGGSL
jgi:hypothetical protein